MKLNFSKNGEEFTIETVEQTDNELMTEAEPFLDTSKQTEVEIQMLFTYELGFSQVIDSIIKSKKPLVGHNMFLDMLFIYSQFIG
jgi:hypothetical protein